MAYFRTTACLAASTRFSVLKNEAVLLYEASRAEVFSHIAHFRYREGIVLRVQNYLFAEKIAQTFVVQ